MKLQNQIKKQCTVIKIKNNSIQDQIKNNIKIFIIKEISFLLSRTKNIRSFIIYFTKKIKYHITKFIIFIDKNLSPL